MNIDKINKYGSINVSLEAIASVVCGAALSSYGVVSMANKNIVLSQIALKNEEDFKKAQTLILELCDKHPLIFKDPAPTVRISAWAPSSINLSCKVWVNNSDYWTVTFDMLETVYDEFNKAGIKIPYNQLEISYRDALKQQEKEGK